MQQQSHLGNAREHAKEAQRYEAIAKNAQTLMNRWPDASETSAIVDRANSHTEAIAFHANRKRIFDAGENVAEANRLCQEAGIDPNTGDALISRYANAGSSHGPLQQVKKTRDAYAHPAEKKPSIEKGEMLPIAHEAEKEVKRVIVTLQNSLEKNGRNALSSNQREKIGLAIKQFEAAENFLHELSTHPAQSQELTLQDVRRASGMRKIDAGAEANYALQSGLLNNEDAREMRELANARTRLAHQASESANHVKWSFKNDGMQPTTNPQDIGIQGHKIIGPIPPQQNPGMPSSGTRSSTTPTITAGTEAANDDLKMGRTQSFDEGGPARQLSKNSQPALQLQSGQTAKVAAAHTTATNETSHTTNVEHGRAEAANVVSKAKPTIDKVITKPITPAAAQEAHVSNISMGIAGAVVAGVTTAATELMHGSSKMEAAKKAVDAIVPFSKAYQLAVHGKAEEALISAAGDIGMLGGGAVGGILGGAGGTAILPGFGTAAGVVGGGAGGAMVGKEGMKDATRKIINGVKAMSNHKLPSEPIYDLMTGIQIGGSMTAAGDVTPSVTPTTATAKTSINPRDRH